MLNAYVNQNLKMLIYFDKVTCRQIYGESNKSVPPHMQHQPTVMSVDITKSCSYSDMLLMMGENIA